MDSGVAAAVDVAAAQEERLSVDAGMTAAQHQSLSVDAGLAAAVA